jgi:hypothetical protein
MLISGELERRGKFVVGTIIDWSTFGPTAGDDRLVPNWDLTTALAALAFCCLGGVKRLLTAGVDFAGEKDADGAEGFTNADGVFEKFGNRSEDRWKLERSIWDAMIAKYGIEWVRV